MLLNDNLVYEVQSSWANGLTKMGSLIANSEELNTFCREFVKSHYAYGEHPVLFKPTKASEQAFRGSFEGAVSYFISSNEKFNEDKGFALNAWKEIQFVNEQISILGDMAMAQGCYYFKKDDEVAVKVEYSFVYKLYEDGQLKIVLHHSSLPFSG